MAKRSQVTRDADVAMQEAGADIRAANGGTPLPTLIAPEIADAPLAPANDAQALSAVPGKGSPQDSVGAGTSVSISVEVDATGQRAAEATSAQTAEGAQAADEAAAPLAAADAPSDPDFRDLRVTDIRKGQLDCRGEEVEFVYVRRRNLFAIYRSSGRILVQYADDEKEARNQVANIAELLPLRDRLQYLVRDMDSPDAYQWQIAESLRLALDGQKEAAKHMMQGAIDNIIAMGVSQGRTTYLLYAGLSVMAVIALLVTAASAIIIIKGGDPGFALDSLMQATGSGAIGALLSTAIALRARTLSTDGGWKSNIVDSAARIMIGVISGAVLYLVLASGLGGSLTLPTDDRAWKIVLLAGFLAGFLERLVPDLLENKVAPAVAK
jgi:hypothetical protein